MGQKKRGILGVGDIMILLSILGILFIVTVILPIVFKIIMYLLSMCRIANIPKKEMNERRWL